MDAYHLGMRLLMRTGGRLSDGIRLGYREGFNSGTMVDYVYRDRAHGITPLGTPRQTTVWCRPASARI